MIPLLAAASAANTIGSLGSEAIAIWKQLTESKTAAKANASLGTGSSTDGGFAAALSERIGKHAGPSSSSTQPDAGHGGPTRAHHPATQRLDQLA